MDLKVAIVHDYLNQYGGAERVLVEVHSIFPKAPIYTLIYDRKKMPRRFAEWDIRTSFLQKMPLVRRHYEKYFLLMPMAVEQFDLSDYNLVLSLSSAWAKGVLTSMNVCHICYCHNPMRFAWEDFYNRLQREKNPIYKLGLRFFLHNIRIWDTVNSNRVDYFIANSTRVKNRIRKYYGKEAEVIPPPCKCDFFYPDDNVRDDGFYLTVSRLRPYKRIDLVIRAFNRLDQPLVIIGDGDERERLEAMANENIKFLGRLSDTQIRDYYQRCKAFIFPCLEDFGIAPIEAQSCGKPVIAYSKGGIRESVIDGKTGVLFYLQTEQALIDAVLKFEQKKFNPQNIRQNALRFSEQRFRERLLSFVHKCANEYFGVMDA